MKKYILLSILCYTLSLGYSQTLPNGVEVLGGSGFKTSFILKDKNGILWCGHGAMNIGGARNNSDLEQYKNGKWQTVYSNGYFTDALEVGNLIYFTNMLGIYEYQNNQYNLDNSVTKVNCIAEYQQKIIVGTIGNGLYEKSASGYVKIPISINGSKYDSIYSLFADGSELWIGTNKGLVKYDGQNFSQYSLPFKSSWNKSLFNNYQTILSVAKDKDGKVWVTNNLEIDSMPCLYFLENGQFTSAKAYYSSQCKGNKILPISLKKLDINSNGNIILGMGWGILELKRDSINCIQIEAYSSNIINQPRVAYSQTIYCDRKGDGSVYSYINMKGLVKIDLKSYSNKPISENGNIAFETIDINDLHNTVANTGIHVPVEAAYDPRRNLPTFNSPSLGCAFTMYSGAVWMGGLEEGSGDLHLAAETYRQRGIDFKPGPIDLVTLTYDSVANSFYNKIWKVNRQTIDDFIANRSKPFYVIPKEILDWPAHGKGNFTKNLAPFVDLDNNGLYEPLKGDYPKIKGDQMLWWVFNDLGKHGESEGLQLGVEVHGSCYAYYYKDLPTYDSNYVINRTLFFDYKIINRSKANYTNFSVGIWNDADLGNYADDYVGCHVPENTGYVYNGDNNDEGEYGFGKNPPHLFCKLLNQKMESFLYYNNNADPINGNPNSASDFYNYMNSKWQNGNDLTFGNNGVGGSQKTKYMFDAKSNPSTSNLPCFNELSAGSQPGDRRFLMSTNTEILKSDSVFDVEFAYIIATNPIDDICNLDMTLPGKIQNWYNQKKFPSKPYYGVGVKNIVSAKNDFLIYPNPTNGAVNIKTDVESKAVIGIQVFDISGKCIYQKLNTDDLGSFNTTLDINAYASGIYLIKIQTLDGALLAKVIKE